MSDSLSRPCTAFEGHRQLARGALVDVALAVRAANDSSWRTELRARLDHGAQKLFDDPAPLEALVRTLGAW